MKHGIAISTYFGPHTHHKRLEIFQRCITSLMSSKYPGSVFLIDDASTRADHLTFAKSNSSRISIYVRAVNGGENRVKNTSLRVLLAAGCDNLFISDDDMIFKDHWWEAYLGAMDMMKIAHMAYTIDGMRSVQEEYRGVKITRLLTPTTNGCFLTMTRKVPETIGGWPIGVEKFGHGHENFSLRALKYGLIPFYCDLQNKKEFVELNKKSNPVRSGRYSKNDIDRNLYLIDNPPMWEPIIE